MPAKIVTKDRGLIRKITSNIPENPDRIIIVKGIL